MTSEELKTLLMSGEEDGADRASIYDKVVTEYEGLSQRLTESTAKIETLTGQVGSLTDSNFKLLEKIRYTDNNNGNSSGSEPEITLSNLFEEV